MIRTRRFVFALAFLSSAAWSAGIVLADSPEGAPQDRFHRAYYLENAEHDFAAAAKLYGQVAADKGAGADLKAKARERLAACKEETAVTDFAALMPPGAIFYAELNRPGDQLGKLAEKLGLLGGSGADAADGAGGGDAKSGALRRVAISPALLNAVLGIRGAAVAITGLDPVNQMPSGVAVIHPGSVDIVRGLIETALPVAGKPAEPIEGFATYSIEGRALVTLTHRLVIVSSQPDQIAGVIRRSTGRETDSLATDAALADSMKERSAGSLLFCCLNPKPIMPLIQAGMAAGAMQARELAMAQALVDIQSLESVVFRLGVNESGIGADLAVRLADGHHNLLYNFLRMPAVDQETLKCVPSGAAAFLVAALNEAPSRNRETAHGKSDERTVVTAMDIGREIFANIIGVAVYLLPPDGASPPAKGRGDGPPIPDVAAVFSVNDPAKSRALWTQILGIASMASGQGTMEGDVVRIDKLEARGFRLPEGITVYLATAGDLVLISPSKSAITRGVAARSAGQSVTSDEAFSKSLSRLTAESTTGLFAHAGRCIQVARPFIPAGDLAEAEPFLPLLNETVASVVVDHSDRVFRFSAQVNGLPKIGGLVSEIVTRELADEESPRTSRRESSAARLVQAAGKGEQGEQGGDDPAEDGTSLRVEFEKLAAKKQSTEAARDAGRRLLASLHDDANELNNVAWQLLTETRYGGRHDALALEFAQACDRATGGSNWMFVDTLALAKFKTGEVREAIELERKALSLCKDKNRRREVEAALARFEAAEAKSSGRGSKGRDEEADDGAPDAAESAASDTLQRR